MIDEDILEAIGGCVERFHKYRESFRAAGIVKERGFNLPRQHSLVHYRWLIQQFGVPNGLSTSITELKHKESVKDVWRRSNKNNADQQMLKTVERTDKMKAQRVLYEQAGLIKPRNKKVVDNVSMEEAAPGLPHFDEGPVREDLRGLGDDQGTIRHYSGYFVQGSPRACRPSNR